MKYKGRSVWILFSVLAGSLVLIAAGFSLVMQEISAPYFGSQSTALTENPSSPEEGLFLALGDSLTRGTGDSKGQGYVGRVRTALQKKERSLRVINLGIKGQTSYQLRNQMTQKRIRQLLNQADHISLTIGGNDLIRASGTPDQPNLKRAEATRKKYKKNLRRILTDIRQENPNAPVFLIGLYNPFSALENKEKTTTEVVLWNQTIHSVSQEFEGIVVIPVSDIFQLHPKLLYKDQLHPNDKGYEVIAERLLQAMNTR
ncbi:GDSL-type esterase/lipase family protein [Salinithrix halophila]|uniref:GDSL-type esterase/lipase family protein n=1 Tax=Salinithrix halophila TaxID=1485204 RepID=A0ABV8JH81_9BACL